MNNKTGVLVIFILGFFIIAATVYYVFFFSEADKSPKEVDTNNSSEIVDGTKIIKNPKQELTEIIRPTVTKKIDTPLGQANLERMARSFAERFGSFSNQSNFSNISDLKMVMSGNMQVWANSYIEKNTKNNVANEVYYGLTTKALSTEVKSFNNQGGEAVIIVDTRRREAMGATNNASNLFNQKILITFVKENQAWRVDSAYWQD